MIENGSLFKEML